MRKHGAATTVEVCVERHPRVVVLTVADNGRGFSATAIEHGEQTEHFGLRLMRDLTDHAGGTLDVRSSPGSGTSVRLEVPVP